MQFLSLAVKNRGLTCPIFSENFSARSEKLKIVPNGATLLKNSVPRPISCNPTSRLLLITSLYVTCATVGSRKNIPSPIV